MMSILEAVPNFSEGRDPDFLPEVTGEMARAGVEVLHASSDPDHHRSVVTCVGAPDAVEAALVAAGALALERIDLRRHRGVHPRIGALDVAPIVPLLDTPMAVARASAERVARGLESLGIPIYRYAESSPRGRTLAELRRGGFEALADGFPADRLPDFPAGRSAAHPSAGATVVGARPLLLAWNLRVEGMERDALAGVAHRLREAGGGLPGVRALALRLPSSGTLQLSMNLEDVERRDPEAVFAAAEAAVTDAGGRIAATEVIGMIPDALVLPTSARRLRLLDADPDRLLSGRVARHVVRRGSRDLDSVMTWIRTSAVGVPPEIQAAVHRLSLPSNISPTSGGSA